MLAGNIQYNDGLEKFSKIADIIDISGSLETKGKDISKINILLKTKKFKMKIRKNKPLIDQHDKNGFWGKKFEILYLKQTY